MTPTGGSLFRQRIFDGAAWQRRGVVTEPRGAAEEAAAVLPVFTPDDEPYRGRPALFHFDQAGELVPGARSVAFSVRELVRQGYLLAAMILIRPLVERVSTLAYLIDHEDAASLWQAGWPYGSRPGLRLGSRP